MSNRDNKAYPKDNFKHKIDNVSYSQTFIDLNCKYIL